MDTVYWIWLSHHCGAGSESGSLLLSEFKTPKDIYDLDEEALGSVEGITGDLIKSLSDKDLSYAEKVYEYCQRTNVGIMTPDSPIYPERLKRIYAKPLVLYYKGKIPNIDENVLISCVGTRTCTDHGLKTAYKLGAQLAEAGAIVVSGMAMGIDSACQRGALAAGGFTVAVLGCGIDVIYPPQNEKLYKYIAEHGAIITEYTPGTRPDGDHFPVRNRIISGLSLATCVVEAPRRSGALITAHLAEKQGRSVFAFPGRTGEYESEGSNDLIRNGATMVRGAKDILEEYELLFPSKIFTENISKNKYFVPKEGTEIKRVEPEEKTPEPPQRPKRRARKSGEERAEESAKPVERKEHDLSVLSELEKAVYASLETKSTADDIRADVSASLGKDIATGDVLAAMTSLEIYGMCRAVPGGKFSLS